jgi:predicted N-formylglutamate amidohydrolase
MNDFAELIAGTPGCALLLIADHASNRIPEGIDLGISPDLLGQHMALDIGVDPLARVMAARLGCPAILGRVSRLVVDLHRERDEFNAIPVISDGHPIPGNETLSPADRELRLKRFWDPYHRLIAETVETMKPRILFALHSFTPRLATRPDEARPWEVGILYNQDVRAAHIAIALLRAGGIRTGDNQPYSGQDLNATMDLHAETRGLPYVVLEVRQDLIGDDEGVALWADKLTPIVRATAEALV